MNNFFETCSSSPELRYGRMATICVLTLFGNEHTGNDFHGDQAAGSLHN